MILFERDWQSYPDAIPDIHTPNRSFVRQCQVYKAMGIRNHLFPLALHNPALQGVNPHDTANLSLEQMVAIGIECRFNPWYYLREIVRLKPQGQDFPPSMDANRGNIALYWAALNHIDVGLIQPRQTGKSISADSLTNWILYFGAINTNMTLITKDDSLRRTNIERLKEMRGYLPKYLIQMSKDDPNNQMELGYSRLKNYFRTAVSQNSEAQATNVGRGGSAPWLQSDEGPFTNMIRISLPAALAAGTAVRLLAEKAGRPYANLFTTTAGRRDHPDGKYMYDLFHNGAEWDERFFDAVDGDEARDMVKKAGHSDRTLVNITLSAQQLGKSDEWLRLAIANAGGSREEIERDFFNVWTSGTLSSPLSTQLNEAIRNSERDPAWVETAPAPYNYAMNWYRPQHEILDIMDEQAVIIGLDTSDAVGRDSIVLVASHPETAEVLGLGRFNETNLMRFSQWLLDFMLKYPKAVLVPEMRSSARTIIDFLLLRLPINGHDPFKRIFNKLVDRSVENPEEYRELNRPMSMRTEAFYNERRIYFGVATDAQIRQTIYGPVLQNAARRSGDFVRSRSLSSEIRSLVVKDGRIDHKAGGHDDSVVSWLLTHWLMMYGRNLEHYGIDPARVLRSVVQVGEVVDPTIMNQRRRRDEVMDRIEKLVEQIADTRDDMVAMKLEFALRALHAQARAMPGQTEELMTIDGMIEKTREERRRRYSKGSMAARRDRQSGGYGNRYAYG